MNRRYRFVAGDSIRALAALSVALYHAGTVSIRETGRTADLTAHGLTGVLGPVGAAVGAGGVGLQVFFVLSGFLISRPFLVAYAGGRSLPRAVPYLRNRALRLLPGLWVALVVVLIFVGAQGASLKHVGLAFALSEDWTSSPLSDHIGQAWTLNIEARFYLLVPVAAFLVVVFSSLSGRPRRARSRLALVGATAAVGAILCLILLPRSSHGDFHWPPAQAHLFLAGIALAAAELGLSWTWLSSRTGRASAVISVAAAVGILLWLQVPDNPLPDLLPLEFNRAVAVFNAIAVSAIVATPVLLQRGGGGCWRALDNAPMRWLGARSYGIYLYQLLILVALASVAPGLDSVEAMFVFLLVIGVAAIVLAAAISWRLVEHPALRLKKKTGPGRDANPLLQTTPSP